MHMEWNFLFLITGKFHVDMWWWSKKFHSTAKNKLFTRFLFSFNFPDEKHKYIRDGTLIIYLSIGRPRPNVTWYLENTVIDESFETRKDGITVNHLSYPNIGRQHLNARLVCVASNTNLTPPNSKAVILDVNCELRYQNSSLSFVLFPHHSFFKNI